MKVGILTHYSVYNQGAQLQLFCLYNILKKLGYNPYVLTFDKNFDFDKEEKIKYSTSINAIPYYVKNYLLSKGIKSFVFNIRKVLNHKKYQKKFNFMNYINNSCDCIISGSDEIYGISAGCNDIMFGYNVNKPMFSYAPSFGQTDYKDIIEHNCENIIKTGLNSMINNSARDLHTKELIYKLTDIEAKLVCDPVILYNHEDIYVNIKPIKKEYMIIYSYDRHMTDPNEFNEIINFAKENKLITVSLGTYHSWCDMNIVCDPQSWYTYFRYAKCVLTDTFHGCIASVKNHANVAVYIRKDINSNKLTSLINDFGINNRVLNKISFDELNKIYGGEKIDYNKVDKNINDMILKSNKYLINSLNIVNKK